MLERTTSTYISMSSAKLSERSRVTLDQLAVLVATIRSMLLDGNHQRMIPLLARGNLYGNSSLWQSLTILLKLGAYMVPVLLTKGGRRVRTTDAIRLSAACSGASSKLYRRAE